jgi:exosortase E/protease (VPEID-CTERM system)
MQHQWLPQSRTFTESVVLFGAALFFFGRRRIQSSRRVDSAIHPGLAALHAGTLLLYAACNLYLTHFAANIYSGEANTPAVRVVYWIWIAAIASLPVSLALALFSPRGVALMVRNLGVAWPYAGLCAVLVVLTRNYLASAWRSPAAHLVQAIQSGTFGGVRAILTHVYPDLVANTSTRIMGTGRFQVEIGSSCSGIEGLVMMLSLTAGWLFYSRRELRLARALLAVPVSLAIIWLLNLVRISTLIAIGNAGYGAIALGGFHSEAGWILFITVAIGFLTVMNSVAWFHTAAFSAGGFAGGSPQIAPYADNSAVNIDAAYVLPLVAIFAASLISQAASSGFEYLYPLRFLAAIGMLWAYRREYRKMDWRFGWAGLLTGVAVFAVWLLSDRWVNGTAAPGTLAAGLAQLPALQRTIWLSVRVLAACTTVPIAEELAFRGFLARRFMSANVESISFLRLTPVAILASSVLFGLMHGKMWFAGLLAGLAFALVAKLRGRIGEAAVAHAVANLLIAVWALTRGNYSLL